MNNAILDPATTRRWMKPMGLVGSLSKAVGAPWEIERLSLPVTASSSRTRVSDLYTKAGGNEGYGANFAISPDHGIGINVLVAGPTWGPDRWTLRDAVGEAFLQAAEWAAFENAKFKFTGTFVSEGHEGSNITVAVDHDHAGLSIEHMFIDGLEWRGNLSYPATEWTPEQLANYSTRLYPMLAEDAPVSGEGGQRVSYRALTYQIPPEDAWQTRAAVDGGQGLFDGWCMSWLAAGFLHSEGQAIDGFVLDFDGDRALVTVEHSLLNLRFVRLE